MIGLSFLLSTAAFAGLTYEGSSTIGENIMPDAVKAFEGKTGIKFDTVGLLGSGKGFKATVEGKAAIGGLSRTLTPDEKKQKVYYQIIGYDAIAVYVNAKNPVKDLSKDQIKGIFTGKIKNWKEVGGPDAPITVITEIVSADRATIKEFKELAMDGAAYGPTKEIDKPHDCVKGAAADVNAITYASFSFKESGVKTIALNKADPTPDNVKSGQYLLSRPLILISKDLPMGDSKKFFEFILSPDGQSIVEKRFIKVK